MMEKTTNVPSKVGNMTLEEIISTKSTVEKPIKSVEEKPTNPVEKEEKKKEFESIPYCPRWEIPRAGKTFSFTTLQAEFLENTNCEKLYGRYRSDCFTPIHFIVSTLQGYACVGSRIDIRKNRELADHLIGPNGWNAGMPSSLTKKFDAFPSKCFIKVSLRFLVENYCTKEKIRVEECVVREMQILKKLKSNKIAGYICHWETQGELGAYYLATEYCDCGWEKNNIFKPMSLFQYITEVIYVNNFSPTKEFQKLIDSQRLPSNQYYPPNKLHLYRRWPVFQGLFQQMVQVVKWLHSQEVAHLDISLENLMISGGELYNPTIKLIDFGLAQDFSKVDRKGIYDKCVGKSTYMAPEVRGASTEKPYNAYAADVWTLGVCLWIMVFKQYPFHYVKSPMNSTRLISSTTYLRRYMIETQLLPMVTEDAFEILDQIFKPADARISIEDLSKKTVV